jgi:hypothetical protein
MESLGLGAKDLRAVNPDFVYTSVSGFGQTGPYRKRAGVNLTMEAFSGALFVTGDPDDMPMRPGIQTADMFGGIFATYAMLAGLLSAARKKAAASTTWRWPRPRSRWRGKRRLSLDRRDAAAARSQAPHQRALPALPHRRRALHRAHGGARRVFKHFMDVLGLEAISPIRASRPISRARRTSRR